MKPDFAEPFNQANKAPIACADPWSSREFYKDGIGIESPEGRGWW